MLELDPIKAPGKWLAEMYRPLAYVRLVVWLAVVTATSWVWLASAEKTSKPPLPPGVSLVSNVPYRLAAGVPLALDLFLPVDAAALELRPVLIAVHGGSWIGGSKSDYGPQFARLAQHGIVVAVVDYQLARPGAKLEGARRTSSPSSNGFVPTPAITGSIPTA